MKKSLLIVGLLLAMSLTASAQYKGFSFGFKLGPSFDWTGSKTGAATNQGTGVGFDVGLVAEYYFAENYAIVTGVNVDFVNGHYKFDDMRNLSAIDTITDYQLGTVDRQFKTTIYEIPLMLKMVTPELGGLPLRAYAQVGAGFGYVPQKVKVKDVIGDAATPSEWSITDGEYNPFRLSLKIGAGAQYALDESTRLFAGLYFSHDFLNNIAPGKYRNYYNGDKEVGERGDKLTVLQNRLGLEVGILF